MCSEVEGLHLFSLSIYHIIICSKPLLNLQLVWVWPFVYCKEKIIFHLCVCCSACIKTAAYGKDPMSVSKTEKALSLSLPCLLCPHLKNNQQKCQIWNYLGFSTALHEHVKGLLPKYTLMSWCLMSSDVIWHIRDKLRPMPKHGSIIFYVHGNQKAH